MVYEGISVSGQLTPGKSHTYIAQWPPSRFGSPRCEMPRRPPRNVCNMTMDSEKTKVNREAERESVRVQSPGLHVGSCFMWPSGKQAFCSHCMVGF